MRAEFFSDLLNVEAGDRISLNRNEYHHLLNVARSKVGEHLVLLDGGGRVVRGIIEGIDSKFITILVQVKEIKNRIHKIDLAVGLCKKESMEVILKQSVELGINRFIPLRTDFSQKNFIKKERIKKIMISSLKQSNSYLLPNVSNISSLEELDFSLYENIFCLSLKKNSAVQCCHKKRQSSLILIGPEGGLSEGEEEWISRCSGAISFIHFPCYILRASTAVATALGWVFAHRD